MTASKSNKTLWPDSASRGQHVQNSLAEAINKKEKNGRRTENVTSCQSAPLLVTPALHDYLRQTVEEMRAISAKIPAIRDKQIGLEKRAQDLQRKKNDWISKHAALNESPSQATTNRDSARDIRYAKFMDSNGQVEANHVTEFQLAIDDLIQATQRRIPEKLVSKLLADGMELVLLAVHRILRDLKGHRPYASAVMAVEDEILSDSQDLVATCKMLTFAVESSIGRRDHLDELILFSKTADKLTHDVMTLLQLVKIKLGIKINRFSGDIDERDRLRINMDLSSELDRPCSDTPSTTCPLQECVPKMLRYPSSLSQYD